MFKRRLIAAACVLVALAVFSLYLGHKAFVAPPSAGNATNDTREIVISPGVVYSAKFTDLLGNSQTLGQWDHKLLVINFWATWCGPCKEEMPILVKLQTKFGERGLQFVGIAADSPSNVANFAKKTSINYPLLLDEANAIEFSKRLGNRLGLLPHTVMMRSGGEVIYNKLGPITETELDDIIAKNMPISR